MPARDIGRDGMLLHWDTSILPVPDLGTRLILAVDLPELQGFERRCIRCQCTVRHTAPEPGERFTWMELYIHTMDFRVA